MTQDQFSILVALGVVRNPKIATALRSVFFDDMVPHQAAVANGLPPPRIYEAKKRVIEVNDQLAAAYAK